MSDHSDKLVNRIAALGAEVEGLRGGLLFEQQASAAYQEDADRLRARVAELEAAIGVVRRRGAPMTSRGEYRDGYLHALAVVSDDLRLPGNEEVGRT